MSFNHSDGRTNSWRFSTFYKNGEKRNLKTKPKTNEQPFEFKRQRRMEYKQRRIRVTDESLNQSGNESTVEVTDALSGCGRGGLRPASKKRGVFPPGWPTILRGCKGAGNVKSEICAGQSTGAVHTSSLCYNKRFVECTAAVNSMRERPMGHGFGCVDGSCSDRHQRHVCVFSSA